MAAAWNASAGCSLTKERVLSLSPYPGQPILQLRTYPAPLRFAESFQQGEGARSVLQKETRGSGLVGLKMQAWADAFAHLQDLRAKLDPGAEGHGDEAPAFGPKLEPGLLPRGTGGVEEQIHADQPKRRGERGEHDPAAQRSPGPEGDEKKPEEREAEHDQLRTAEAAPRDVQGEAISDRFELDRRVGRSQAPVPLASNVLAVGRFQVIALEPELVARFEQVLQREGSARVSRLARHRLFQELGEFALVELLDRIVGHGRSIARMQNGYASRTQSAEASPASAPPSPVFSASSVTVTRGPSTWHLPGETTRSGTVLLLDPVDTTSRL